MGPLGRWERYTVASRMAGVKTDAVLVPPGQRGSSPAAMKDSRPVAALIVTVETRGARLGTKIDLPSAGISLGGPEADVEIEGASHFGTRLRIEWVDAEGGAAASWRAVGVGRVTINDVPAGGRRLASGDHVRVVDSYFRFLSGVDLTDKLHETIYHLTIVDFATHLNNARFLAEALEREMIRAQRHARRLAVAAVRFEHDNPEISDHDLVVTATRKLRIGVRREWVAARSGEREVVVVAPDSSGAELERKVREWLGPGDPSVRALLGIAEYEEDSFVSSLLERARQAATEVPSRLP